MGAAQSTAGSFSSHQEQLGKLAGQQDIGYGDVFWHQLFNLQQMLAAEAPISVQEAIAPHCRQLLVHNPVTHNFQKVVLHALDLVSLAQNGKPTLAVANSLHILHVMVKCIIETCSPSTLSMVFEVAPNLPPAVQGQQSLLPLLINRLVLLICNTQPSDEMSYLVLLEAVILLLVCTSTQLYTQQTAALVGSHPLLEALMEQQQCTPALTGALLQLIVQRHPLPQKRVLYTPAPNTRATVMRLVRTAAATVFWIPLRTYQYIVRTQQHQGGLSSPLADVALSLLLVLAHYPAQHAQLVNGVKQALHGLQDAAATGDSAGDTGRYSSPGEGGASISFSRLYDFFATGHRSEASTLLLYTLLHGSKSFQEYVLVRSDPETLLVPVLEQLYQANRHKANHLYMLQIILLILSQDTSFSHNIHKVLLPGTVSWYRERMLHKISLGSLVFVVLLRTAHQNVGQLQDLYLPTNTLAALANLAPQAIALHSHAAQRLIGLTVQLARRWLKLSQASGEPLAAPPQELQVLHEFLRILLEVINCILSLNLTRNPELVYALLHKQDVFAQLRGQQGLAEPVENIQIVIDYFNSRLDSLNSQAGAASEGQAEWSVDRVLELVQTFTQTWRGDRLRQLPEMRFVYEEEAAPEEFFVPYCWSLAVAATSSRLVSWNLGAAALLTQLSGIEVTPDSLEGQTSTASSHRWSDDGVAHESQV